ncbi:MAG: coproporphyrinogen dehydrogenase HemZ [Clostridia bacterium]|nr:coproporphyrinogen dehydrogenase HemZ [Clostridia bacterium]
MMDHAVTSVRLTTNLDWLYPELSEVIRLFLGDIPIAPDAGAVEIAHIHTEENGMWTENAVLDGNFSRSHCVKKVSGGLEEKRTLKRAAKTALFLLMSQALDRMPPWGSLTGIRPTRLIYEGMSRGMTLEEAENWVKQEFFVSDEKASLLKEIVTMQKGIIEPPKDTFDLYIGIPFCVTRCAYCSFASGEIGNGKLTEPYVDALIQEIRETSAFMKKMNLRLRAGYMGGGTPTSLSADQLDRILKEAMHHFPDAVEWTVEAGRPDTIDKDKLLVIRNNHVDRISVNPQTFKDETLKIIGRRHTSEETLRAFHLAREIGFDHINMDLIAALPGEDFKDFERTLSIVTDLNPESVTVHSLAIKRSSKLHEQLTVQGTSHNQADCEMADDMIRYARKTLSALGWRPYYLYRQKYMAGNLENVGYAKPGKACLYNIGNMEETARVLALGAGAISKWIFPRERRIERAPNVKNIEEYIARVHEMTERKRILIMEDERS